MNEITTSFDAGCEQMREFLREYQNGSTTPHMVKLAAETALLYAKQVERMREALLQNITAMERVSEKGTAWDYEQRCSPYGVYYAIVWSDDNTPEWLLDDALKASREAMEAA